MPLAAELFQFAGIDFRGDDHHGERLVEVPNKLKDRFPLDGRQIQVEEDHFRSVLLDLRNRLRPSGRLANIAAQII